MISRSTDSHSDFAVSFEGEAFANHSMDVRDLAPALIALGQAFDRANVLLNGDRADISLNIRATRPASFEVELVLNQVFQGASDILSGEFLTKAALVTELIIGGPTIVAGIVTVIKKCRGKKHRVLEEQPNAVTLEVDNLRLTVPRSVLTLLDDKSIREQLEAFVRPLQKEGADRVVFKRDKENIESIRHDEAEYFAVDFDDTNTTEYIIPSQRLQINNLTFKGGKWRLSDGGNVHWYAMDDTAFLTAINQGKRFGIDDILVCEVHMTQRIDETGKLKMEYAVERVLRHIVPGEQLPFSDMIS